jgi:hypothetical protein
MEHRDERIIIETVRHRISGLVRLPVDGYRSRLTDYLNAAEREFLALTDVEVTSLNGSPRVEQRDFVALSLRHIVLAMPATEATGRGESSVAAEAPSRSTSSEPAEAPQRSTSSGPGKAPSRPEPSPLS